MDRAVGGDGGGFLLPFRKNADLEDFARESPLNTPPYALGNPPV
jgi:hypothetical protein